MSYNEITSRCKLPSAEEHCRVCNVSGFQHDTMWYNATQILDPTYQTGSDTIPKLYRQEKNLQVCFNT